MLDFNAAVLDRPGEPLSVERIEINGVGPDDVLVQVRSAGVCHTDWEAQHGSFGAAVPLVLGHEGAGIVVEVGSEVEHLAKGDAVVFSPFPVCGICFYCRRSQPMLCEPVAQGHRSGRLPDGEPRLFRRGEPVGQFLAISSFSEFAVVPANGAVRIPGDVPLDLACLLGCAVITGVGAALRIAEIAFDETVCVIGCGPVGLNAIQGARLAGARLIMAVDPKPERRSLAERFGATHVIDPLRESVQEQVLALTSGRGADHGLETAGREDAIQGALDCTRPGGTVTILGKMDPQSHVKLRFGSLMGERRIRRSALGGGRTADDIPAFARAYLDGKLLLDELVSARVPLARINEALADAGQGTTIRSVVLMN